MAINVNTPAENRFQDHDEVTTESETDVEPTEFKVELTNESLDYPDLDSPISFHLESKDNLMKNIEEALSNSKEFKFLLKEQQPSSTASVNADSTENLHSMDSSSNVGEELISSSTTTTVEPVSHSSSVATWTSRWSPDDQANNITITPEITNGDVDLCDSSSSPDTSGIRPLSPDKPRAQSPADSAVSLSEGSFASLPVVTSTPHNHLQKSINDGSAYLTARQDESTDTPPELPTSPVPPASSLVTTYITEIQVSSLKFYLLFV